MTTLNKSWYTGILFVTRLHLNRCNIDTIESTAFEAFAFRYLDHLSLQEMHNFAYQPTLNELQIIEIYKVHFRSLANNIFEPLRSTLNSIELSYYPADLDLSHIFGTHFYHLLLALRLVGDGAEHVERTLRRSSLPSSKRIQSLALIRLGIVAIDEDTFDFGNDRLDLLDLSDNKLKTLQLRIVADYFDSRLWTQKRLLFYNNPLECSCDLYEMQNMSILGLDDSLSDMPVCKPIELPGHGCDNMQRVTLAKYKLIPLDRRFHQAFYSFTKLHIHLKDKDHVVIGPEFGIKIRLLVQHQFHGEVRFRNRKCPSQNWMRNSMACIILRSNSSQILAINTIMPKKSNIIMVSALLTIATKRAFPLHIQTVHDADVANDDDGTDDGTIHAYVVFGMLMLLCMVSLIVGMGTVILWRRQISKLLIALGAMMPATTVNGTQLDNGHGDNCSVDDDDSNDDDEYRQSFE